ncbi:bifunctional phosphatase PAP2/diacylglycerol kinase family protein [Nocardia tengchongensis]|uniref:bifunctional phosphatase PAP2/diacylglycerol kinase family protein n=1 Tax=Nocardia tengchongensis TaxID=2055889 RepID=UPI0036BA58F2
MLHRTAVSRSIMLDRVLPTLGRAADHGVLWLAVASAMGSLGDRKARRGALRGVVALSVASAMSNVVGKRLVRRPRPSNAAIPAHRRLTRPPFTTGFPSGHAASAAAFATGVALEAAPVLSVPLAGLAMAVALSRVVTGAHYPSDVLAGAALGVGAGAVTRWWWPRHPPGPAQARVPAASVPASAEGEGVVVVVNTAAGNVDAPLVESLITALPRAEITCVGPGGLDRVLQTAVGRARVLGIVGGDGMVNAAVGYLAGHGIPLLLIPAGTLNHFAAELGLNSLDDAVNALRTASAVSIDIGRVGDRVFVNTCGFGLYTDLVRFRTRWEPSIGKWPAVLMGMIQVVRHGSPVRVVIDGHQRELWTVFIGNGRYRPQGFAPAYRPRLDDGHLDVRIVDATVPFAATRSVLALLTRTLRWCRAYETCSPTRLRLAQPDHTCLTLSLDGEVAHLADDVVIEVEPDAVSVYRPLPPQK